MIETSTILSSFPRSKRKNSTLLVALSIFFAAFVMTTVVKYDPFPTNTPAETKIAASTNASSTKEEALIISRVLQPDSPTSGKHPLDEIMVFLENKIAGEMQTNILNSIIDNLDSTKDALVSSVNDAKSEIITAVDNVESDLTSLISTSMNQVATAHEHLKEILSHLKDELIIPPLQFSIGSIDHGNGSSHICAVFLATVECVGSNWVGESGIDTLIASSISTPVSIQIPSPSKPVKVVIGNHHSCVLMRDQTVFCYGFNGQGQLGDGTTRSSHIPVQVMKEDGSVLTDVKDLVAGTKENCAILSQESTIHCWGLPLPDPDGQIDKHVFQGQTNVAMIAISSLNACIVLHTNLKLVTCKGSAELDGKDFLMDAEIIKLTSGILHFCALLKSGIAKCFGYNSSGQLGNGTVKNVFDTATPILDAFGGMPLIGITDIAADAHSTCLLVKGTPMCFGDNRFHQLGIAGEEKYALYPTRLNVFLPTQKKIASVHAGVFTGHVVFADNTVYSFGSNIVGTIGDGSEQKYGRPVRDVAARMLFDFSYIVDIAAVKADTESILEQVIDAEEAHEDMKKNLSSLLTGQDSVQTSLQLSLTSNHLCALLLSKVQCVRSTAHGNLVVDPSMTLAIIGIAIFLISG